jgi:hypothetical protein
METLIYYVPAVDSIQSKLVCRIIVSQQWTVPNTKAVTPKCQLTSNLRKIVSNPSSINMYPEILRTGTPEVGSSDDPDSAVTWTEGSSSLPSL